MATNFSKLTYRLTRYQMSILTSVRNSKRNVKLRGCCLHQSTPDQKSNLNFILSILIRMIWISKLVIKTWEYFGRQLPPRMKLLWTFKISPLATRVYYNLLIWFLGKFADLQGWDLLGMRRLLRLVSWNLDRLWEVRVSSKKSTCMGYRSVVMVLSKAFVDFIVGLSSWLVSQVSAV